MENKEKIELNKEENKNKVDDSEKIMKNTNIRKEKSKVMTHFQLSGRGIKIK